MLVLLGESPCQKEAKTLSLFEVVNVLCVCLIKPCIPIIKNKEGGCEDRSQCCHFFNFPKNKEQKKGFELPYF